MLSIRKATSGYEQYFLQQATVRYYTEGGERPGHWAGAGAARLGLTGEVDPRLLVNLSRGMKPDGSGQLIELNSIRHDRNHIAMYDLCWSPPKDVSLLWALYPDLKPKVEKCQEKAISEGLRYAQAHAAFTRRGAGGKHLEKGELVNANFVHGTNRNGEPQLHTHSLLMNALGRPDGGFGTIVSKFLYHHQIAMRRVYATTLAIELQRELGVKVAFAEAKPNEPGDHFRIVGVPDRLRDLMSTRRAEILAAKAELGLTTAKGAQLAALLTRSAKMHLPEDFLRQKWLAIVQRSGFNLDELRKAVLVDQVARPAHPMGREHRDDAEDQKPKPASSASGKVASLEARREARSGADNHNDVPGFSAQSPHTPQTSRAGARPLDHGMSSRVPASILEALVKSALADKLPDPAVNRLIDHVLEQFEQENPVGRFANRTDRARAAHEALPKLLAAAQELHANVRHAIQPDDLRAGLAGPVTTQPGDAAFVEVLKRGSIVCVHSKPGTDEAELVNGLAREYAHHGKQVKVLASTAAAAHQLETLTDVPVYTVRQHLSRLNLPTLDVAKHHALQILKAAIQQQTKQLDAWKIDRDTVLVVTQAQAMRTEEMATLLAKAEAAGAKVVLFGDSGQIAKREPHNAFSEVAAVTGKVAAPAPAKQSEPWMSDAARQAAQGDVRGALSQYALAERLQIHKDQRGAAIALVDHWKQLPRSEQDGKTLLIAASVRETRLLNKMAQESRRQSGKLPRLMWQRVGKDWVYRGDRLQFHIGSKYYGFKAGDFGTIERINLASMTIRLDRTKGFLGAKRHIRVDVPKSLYRGLSLGYAVNAAQAQGLACERALILARAGGEDPRGMAVQLSCGRAETWVFATPRAVGEDIEAISNSIRRQSQADRLQPQTVKNHQGSRTEEVAATVIEERKQQRGIRV